MALICGFIGTFIIFRRLSFLADTISHASILGIGIGHALGFAPSATLIPFALLLSVLLTWISRNRNENLQAITAVAFSGCVGIGVLLMSHDPAHESDELMHILFGHLEHVSMSDMFLLAGLGIPAAMFVFINRRKLILTFLDENLAIAQGIRTSLLHYTFMACTALVIAVSLKLVGVVLVMALITIPALTAGRLSRSLSQQLWLSPVLASACAMTGAMANTANNHLPLGPLIAAICAAVYVIALCVRSSPRS
jgi:zinc transport system permease protein